jgi:Protein of unknown function (DUF2939)
MKRLVVPLLVIGIAVVAGWYYWTGTIQYSLWRIKRAVDTHDKYLFEQHVDVESISKRLADDTLSAVTEDVTEKASTGWEQVGAGLGVAVLQMWKPQLIEQIEDGIIASVETGTINQGSIKTESQESNAQLKNGNAPAAVALPTVKPIRLGKIKRYGSTAIVELIGQAKVDEPEKVMRFRLVRTPGRYWQVTELENFTELFQSARDSSSAKADMGIPETEAKAAIAVGSDARLEFYFNHIKQKVAEEANKHAEAFVGAPGAVRVRFIVLRDGGD